MEGDYYHYYERNSHHDYLLSIYIVSEGDYDINGTIITIIILTTLSPSSASLQLFLNHIVTRIFTIDGQKTSVRNGSDDREADDHEADDHDCYDQAGDNHDGDNHEADDQHGGDHDVDDYDRHAEDGDAADDDIHLQFSLLRPRVGSLEPATRILRLLQNKTASMLMVAMMMTRVAMNTRK